jgi:hypothetical protein
MISSRQKPLGQQIGHGMFDKAGMALIAETSRQPGGQAQGEIDLAEQQHPAVAGESAAGKIGDHFSGTEVLKEQRLIPTVCRRRSGGGWFHLAQ